MPNTNGALLEEIEQLRLRLQEAEAVVEAIRNSIVDAVVVHSTSEEMVYTLEGAERPYRLLVEAMQQGVAVLNSEEVVLYCNPCFAENFSGCPCKTSQNVQQTALRQKPTTQCSPAC